MVLLKLDIAEVAELVDAHDSGSCAPKGCGSLSLLFGTL